MDPLQTDYLNYKLIDGPLLVENMKVFQGANYFSGGPVLLIRLNLGSFDEVFTNQINGFFENLSALIPSLSEHHCSEARKGGFFFRVKEGTLLGHVIEHVALELQTLAGMDAGYGKTRSTLTQGVYNIIFRFLDEEAGLYAGKAAVNLVNSILLNMEFGLNKIIEDLINIREKNLLGPSTQAIVDEAEKRKIPALRLDDYNLVQLGTGKFNKKIRATITSDTNLIAVETADSKYLTTLMLKDAGIPVLETIKTDSAEDVIAFGERINSAIVIKPSEAYQGKNLRIDLTGKDEIEEAFNYAMQFNQEVIAQPYFKGNSYRLLVINFKFVAAAELIPPFITGNGKATILELVDELNANPLRQKGDKTSLSKVALDEISMDILKQHAYDLTTILKEGEMLYLKNSGNMRLGGTAMDVTELVDPSTIFLAERAARVIDLNVAGVDILAADISKAFDISPGYVLEVNAAPDFRMHISPTVGIIRKVAGDFLDMLFPPNTQTRIPLVSVTGSYGKTATTKLLEYCLKQEGYKVGLANSEGLYIDGIKLLKGNMTFAASASLVLKDPTVDLAILETSCEGILRNGIGYQFADYGLVLNINDEHLGKDDISLIEDLAYAKSVVAEQVYDDGFAILNAEQELVQEMKERAYGNLVLFSEKDDNPAVIAHTFRGGMAVYIKENKIILHNRGVSLTLIAENEIPFIENAKEGSCRNILLAACCVLFAHKVKTENIVKYLKTYVVI
jgi:cyanophycin synthetase